MPRGGAKPGERRGGRTAGTPNKATQAREARAAMAAEIAAEIGNPQAANAIADVLSKRRSSMKTEMENEIIPMLKGIMASFQHKAMEPAVGGGFTIKDPGQFAEFKEWLKIYCEASFRLMEYQDPKYRAIAVAMAPGDAKPAQMLALGPPRDAAERERRSNSSYLTLVKG